MDDRLMEPQETAGLSLKKSFAVPVSKKKKTGQGFCRFLYYYQELDHVRLFKQFPNPRA